MPKGLLYFLVLLMIPTFAEAMQVFSVNIPGLPFSLGRLSFLIAGLIGLVYKRNFFFKSDMVKGMILIIFGSLVGAVFSDSLWESVSRALGNIVLIIGSIGVAGLVSKRIFQRSLDLFFIANLAYWTYYVFSLLISSGFNLISYSKLFMNEGAVNHHIIGINSSVSCIFIALRYFYLDGKLGLFGYLTIFVGIMNCFLSETRSNLIITILILFLILVSSKLKISRVLFISIPVLVLMFFVLVQLASVNENLLQRFDATDEDYQGRTTGMRIEYINGALESFVKSPFGKGVYGAEIDSSGFSSTMVHNQYLTFILSGGLLALLGIVLWFRDFVKITRHAIKFRALTEGFNYAAVFSMLAFLVTLFTIEFTGIMFFLYAAILIYLSGNYLFKKKSLKRNFPKQGGMKKLRYTILKIETELRIPPKDSW